MRPSRLAEALTTIQEVLRRTARMNSRSKHPNTCQLLVALTTEDDVTSGTSEYGTTERF